MVAIVGWDAVVQLFVEGLLELLYLLGGKLSIHLEDRAIEGLQAVFLVFQYLFRFQDGEVLAGNKGSVVPRSSLLYVELDLSAARHEEDEDSNSQKNDQQAVEKPAVRNLIVMIETAHRGIVLHKSTKRLGIRD